MLWISKKIDYIKWYTGYFCHQIAKEHTKKCYVTKLIGKETTCIRDIKLNKDQNMNYDSWQNIFVFKYNMNDTNQINCWDNTIKRESVS